MQWDEYWTDFVVSKKLNNKIQDMDKVDIDINGRCQIKDICHKIYDDYCEYKKDLEKIRTDLLKTVVDFQEVHLQTSRVKTIDSLLKKVIERRSAHLLDKSNLYSGIDGENYKEIVTDLIGVRFIIDHRKKWMNLHQKILESFPYVENKELYSQYKFIPHSIAHRNCIAEIPKAYYAFGDDISMYEKVDVKTYMKENGYRSVHYVMSFKQVYIEIQVRTIYDEAWSNCDHNYVYKNEDHCSYAALREISAILNLLTNTANDLGETMQKIYDNRLIYEINGKYKTEPDINLQIQNVFDRIENAKQHYEEFQKRIV